jgi:hypothetical protein
MPSISRVDSPMPCLPSLEMNPLHVIFDMNEVFVQNTSIGSDIEELHLAPSFSSLD